MNYIWYIDCRLKKGDGRDCVGVVVSTIENSGRDDFEEFKIKGCPGGDGFVAGGVGRAGGCDKADDWDD